MKWTLQIKTMGRWQSRMQCEDRERLKVHAATLPYDEIRIVLLEVKPERIIEDSRGRMRRVGLKQW